MSRRRYAEHARVTAICVNLALDSVEEEILSELARTDGEIARTLERLLSRVRERRVPGNEIGTARRC
jgi:hypothetical protein